MKTYIMAAGLVIFLLLWANHPKAEIEVYDADGQYLGILLNMEGTPPNHKVTIYIPSLEKWTILSKGMIDDSMALKISFQTSDCSGGKPFQTFENTPFFGSYILGSECGGGLYYSIFEKWTVTLKSMSAMAGPNPQQCMCIPIFFEGECWRLYDFNPLDLPFTLPVRYPLMLKKASALTSEKLILGPPPY